MNSNTMRYVGAAVVVVAACVTALVATDTLYVYGDSTALNEGVVLGSPELCVGFEWKGVPGPFDCRDQGE